MTLPTNDVQRMREMNAAVADLQAALLVVYRLRRRLAKLVVEAQRADAADRTVTCIEVVRQAAETVDAVARAGQAGR
jgi:galactokinase/mevalonate kinase-like predicted kinase